MRLSRLATLWTLLAWCSLAGAADPQTLPLWPDGAPGALGEDPGNENNPGDIPTITIYRPAPEQANGASIVVCPGGGYGFLANDHEGRQVADWLNAVGVSAVILKYRLGPNYRHPAPLQDVQRALRTVRARAEDWNLDPSRVGVLGFSAGGHLASTVATHFDLGDPDADDPIEHQSCRPDLLILGYPVIAFATPYGHTGSKRNLLGDDPDPELVEDLSNERRVTRDTPPTFLVHTNEDSGVPAENSILFVLALRQAGVPVEFHLFERGRHGLGLGVGLPSRDIPPDDAFKAWPSLCETWMRGRGFLEPQEGTQPDASAPAPDPSGR